MSADGTSAGTHDPAETRDFKFVVGTIFLMLALNVPASLLGLGWKSAAINTALMSLLFAVYVVRHRRDTYLLGWAVVGVAAGFTELIADWWLVHRTESLVYAPGEPMIVASPLYMPFAWALLVLQLGMVAQWLRGRMPAVAAALFVGLIAGVNIPLYEHLAKDAGWWYYRLTPMLWNAPYYIILGEFLVGLPLVWLAPGLRRRPLARGLVRGILVGLVILVAYVFAWWLVGPCTGAVLQLPCG